ncbi:HAD-IIA family hydrolase [Paenibacillus sp. 1001270B_150601_E10]|uniref:HAD-IIA family hydrolase n=1 Tax=Paenibacillus sp. 1001270B_150601_E10 TaxID=2787079 RepID=UPI0018A10809|nr:HAD-IIA family hydrolase [Paenibacillus sp. 1001270B_150601_E10]
MEDLYAYDAFCFDLDGTIYIDQMRLPGVKSFISELRARGKRLLFLTNTSVHTREDCYTRLLGLDVPCQLEEILTAGYVSGMYLAEHAPDAWVLVIGEEALKKELRSFGLTITEDPHRSTHVLVGMDRQFHYDKLHQAATAVRHGAVLLAVNPDTCCPVQGDIIPDTGSILKSIEAASEQEAAVVIGKPSRYYAAKALQLLDVNSGRCLMIGDRLETDILFGKQNGMKTALVLTGIASKEDVEVMDIVPDYIWSSLNERSLGVSIHPIRSTAL